MDGGVFWCPWQGDEEEKRKKTKGRRRNLLKRSELTVAAAVTGR